MVMAMAMVTAMVMEMETATAMVCPAAAGPPEPTASPDAMLPDRDSERLLEPVVADVADPRLATVLALPAGEGDQATWGEVIAGVLQQAAARPGPPGSGIVSVQEWFIERTSGEVVAVAIPSSASASDVRPPRRGTRVEVRALRIGTLEAVSRDGVVRRWPLHAGRPVATRPMSTATAAVVAATLLAAGGWFLLRRRLAARRAISIREVVGSADRSHAEPTEPPMDLPIDPAEALDVLAARAEESEPRA